MTELDFDADQFLQLLTDALRAGPGSPEWHDAVTRLRDRGAAAADAGSNGTVQLHKEYQLLVAAREHLESGREYRSVRPGAVFTSRVMHAIDDEAERRARRGPWPMTRVVG